MKSAQVPQGFAVLAIMSCTKPGDKVVEVTWDAMAEPVIASTALALMRVPAVVGGGVHGDLVREQFIKVSRTVTCLCDCVVYARFHGVLLPAGPLH